MTKSNHDIAPPVTDTVLEVTRFTSLVSGPHLLLLGAVHGDEICGPIALKQLIMEIQRGTLSLISGALTIVPVCNPRAHHLGKRFVEKNLNRVIVPKKDPVLYEEQLSQKIISLIDTCDILLDLHSYHTHGPAFVCNDVLSQESEAFAKILGPSYSLTGWDNVFETKETANMIEGDTQIYARHRGKLALTLECGQHNDPNAPEIALQAAKNALAYFKLCNLPQPRPDEAHKLITFKQMFPKKDHGSLTQDWGHMDPIKKGDIVATYEDGGSLASPMDGYILLPKPVCDIGEEWFYIGVETGQ
ncbi:MAG: hypothetical protein EOM37_04600 [Proteobacteria bacterium]|jgi:predicted deacylase|nr:succinylglutamate desuccinylase/aspartoacylase family protein [Alphaproteobacteria bacterium]NCC03312.1 hypothetical protein [Pseudomonadota bacterium]